MIRRAILKFLLKHFTAHLDLEMKEVQDEVRTFCLDGY